MLQAARHTVPATKQHPWLEGSEDSTGGKDSKLWMGTLRKKIEAWVHFSGVDFLLLLLMILSLVCPQQVSATCFLLSVLRIAHTITAINTHDVLYNFIASFIDI